MKKALMFASVASMIDIFNQENIKVLQDLGYQVDVACNFEYGSITSNQRVLEFRNELKQKKISAYHIEVPRNIMSIKKIIYSYIKISKLIKKNDYDLVHCHSPIGGVLARVAGMKYRKKGLRMIYTAHGFHFFKGSSFVNWLLYFPIEFLCSFSTDTLITINKEDYKVATKLKMRKSVYLPGIGIDVKKISNSDINIQETRKSFGITDDDFLLFSAGQLSKRKNHEIILKSIYELKDPHIKLLLCGLGEKEIYLRKLAISLGIENQIIFAGFRTDVKKLLHISDCFIFPSLQEGLPVALMEAMAAGLPVIASKIRGNVDLIEEGGGYLVNNFVQEYVVAIRKIKSSDRTTFGEINYMKSQKYDIKVVNDKMKEIYSQ